MIKQRLIRRADGKKTWTAADLDEFADGEDMYAAIANALDNDDRLNDIYHDVAELVNEHFYCVDFFDLEFDSSGDEPNNVIGINGDSSYDETINKKIVTAIHGLNDFGFSDVYDIYVAKDNSTVYTSGGDYYEIPMEIDMLRDEGFNEELNAIFLKYLNT